MVLVAIRHVGQRVFSTQEDAERAMAWMAESLPSNVENVSEGVELLTVFKPQTPISIDDFNSGVTPSLFPWQTLVVIQ